MARKQRVHYPGAVYHVMVRGNNGEGVFSGDLHKSEYIKILSHYQKRFSFRVHAFCIMDNHAHLLMKVKDIPLSAIMQRVQQVYTQWYNRTYARTGHVFQQRYKALVCNKEGYLLQLVKYIHYNPVRAGIADSVNAYKWSSHLHYMDAVERSLVDVSFLLDTFSENRKQAIKQYIEFMDQTPDEKEIGNYAEEHPPFLQKDINQPEKLSINEVIERVCLMESISIEELAKRSRVWKISDIRKAIVLLSETHCSVSNTALCQILNLPLSMISKIKSCESKRTYVREVIGRFEKAVSE